MQDVVSCKEVRSCENSFSFGKPYRYLGEIDLGNSAKITQCENLVFIWLFVSWRDLIRLGEKANGHGPRTSGHRCNQALNGEERSSSINLIHSVSCYVHAQHGLCIRFSMRRLICMDITVHFSWTHDPSIWIYRKQLTDIPVKTASLSYGHQTLQRYLCNMLAMLCYLGALSPCS
jgi:hypothetical protein